MNCQTNVYTVDVKVIEPSISEVSIGKWYLYYLNFSLIFQCYFKGKVIPLIIYHVSKKAAICDHIDNWSHHNFVGLFLGEKVFT